MVLLSHQQEESATENNRLDVGFNKEIRVKM